MICVCVCVCVASPPRNTIQTGQRCQKTAVTDAGVPPPRTTQRSAIQGGVQANLKGKCSL